MLAPHIPYLWSPGDDADLRHCDACLASRDLAGALLSIEGADERTRREAQGRIEVLADQVRRAPSLTPDGALVAVLGPALRVTTSSPSDVITCALSQVVAGRPGQPTVVAAAWLLVAWRAGVNARAIALPGQVVIAVEPGSLVIDPSTATRLDPGAWAWDTDDAESLPACSPEALADQVLRDLLFCAEVADDDISRFRSVNFLAHMHPDDPGPQVALGLVAEAIGAVGLADAIYARVSEEFEDAHEARIAHRRQRWLARHPRWLQ